MKNIRFINTTRRFLAPIWKNKVVTLFFIFYFLLELAFGVVFVFFVKDITNVIEKGVKQDFYELLGVYALIIVLLFMTVLFFHKLWTYSYNRYRESIESLYLPQYIQFDMNFQEKVGTGKSIAIISKGVQKWGTLLDNIIIHILRFSVSVSLTFYLLFQINKNLAFLLIILLIVGQVIGILLNRKILQYRKKRIELDNRWSKGMVKIIMAKMEILQSQKIQREISKLHKLHEGQIYYNKKMSLYLVPFFMLGVIIITILLFIVFIHFGELYFEGKISLGIIVGTTGAVLMMQNVFIDTLDFLKNFTKEFAEVQNMWDFFDEAPQIEGYEEGKTFEHKTGEISLKNISYGYDETKPVFQDFSLDIPGNQITALVGPSGGGKSTLAKLISGYIRQDSGDILIDKQNLKDVSLKSYFADIGYLTQEPNVFDGTVRENLLYAAGDNTSAKQIEEIIKLAHCEFIYDLVKGLDTEIGERGVKLSGGQKQRLAIAKIFLKNPKIIILDEPTSALDSLSEQKITQAMHNLFQDRTVLVIAHRLQTVKYADDIIVIESGKIQERGTHRELVRKKGFYKQMLDLQSGF